MVRVHVFEFVTGGGLSASPLPAHLAREGDLMLAALLDDLLEIGDLQISFSRDARLPAPDLARLKAARICWRGPDAAPQESFKREIDQSDATWPIAPETGGELEHAARAVLEAGRLLLGPQPDAIALAASKSATARRLAEAGIDVVPCFRALTHAPDFDGPWVVKPDDGAGCVDTHRFEHRREAIAALGAGRNLIAQPWVEGDPMSLCVLAGPDGIAVLSVNRQHLQLCDGAVELTAVEVNCSPVTASLQMLASRVAAAVPGLQGFFGIDFVQPAGGPPVVVEINPRLTNSYAGLKAALGVNVAQSVLAAARGGRVGPLTPRWSRPVRLQVT
jgi:predicted ATP-grasp superfamily ATP-dependent carboligase